MLLTGDAHTRGSSDGKDACHRRARSGHLQSVQRCGPESWRSSRSCSRAEAANRPLARHRVRQPGDRRPCWRSIEWQLPGQPTRIFGRRLWVDSVEKLERLAARPVFRGHSTLGEVAIVDPASIWEVDFRDVTRSSSQTEFFNRIGRVRVFAGLSSRHSIAQATPHWHGRLEGLKYSSNRSLILAPRRCPTERNVAETVTSEPFAGRAW